MSLNFRGLFLALFLIGVGTSLHAQERLCPDGKRSYFGVCPDDGNESRPLDKKIPAKLPPCPSNQWFREWHMCHTREELGGGLVIDADFMNGAIHDPSAPAAPPVAYTLIDKFVYPLDIGALSLDGASIFINFAELVKEGNKRKFKLLVNFDKKHPFMLSKRIGVDSVAVPLQVQCRFRTFTAEGEVVGFMGAMGQGYPLVLGTNPSGASEVFKEADILKTATENGDSAMQMSRVVGNVLNTVCKP